MPVLYNIYLNLFYYLFAPVIGMFSEKINNWLQNQKNINSVIQKKLNQEKKRIWFHCASVGEYEQIKPIITYFEDHYKYQIIISFFSPTAYKYLNNKIKHPVLLMPLDTANRMGYFIKKINPEKIFISKNEVWPNMINISFKKSIPIYLIAAKIKEKKLNHLFYGKYYCNLLNKFSGIFVQDEFSKKFLDKKNIKSKNVGDPRIDQVILNLAKQKTNILIKNFCQKSSVIIAGSTEKEDYKFIIDNINSDNNKWIIVPHENSMRQIQYLTKKITVNWALYSKSENLKNSKVLIVDKIGILKNIYFYGDVIYVGGGFSNGIHNCLEPAIFGKPILFGPNYRNFPEAEYFVKNKIAFAINNKQDFKNIMANKSFDYSLIKENSSEFFKLNKGASKNIISEIIT